METIFLNANAVFAGGYITISPTISTIPPGFLGSIELGEMGEEGSSVISCHTIEAWNEQLEKGNDSKKLVVVNFTASWCGPCRFISPFLGELAKMLPDVTFVKVDVDELKSIASDWAIEAMPTFMFLKEGTIVDKVVGAKKEELQQKIAMHKTT